jgi:hypothetical protein
MHWFIILLQCDKEWGKRIIPCPDAILRIPKSGVLQRNSIFGYSNVEYGILDGPDYGNILFPRFIKGRGQLAYSS